MKTYSWKVYLFEFLSIFIAVISAFSLTNWSESRNSKESEQKILIEIKNGINIDTKDFNGNIQGHKLSISAIKSFRKLITNNSLISKDSISLYYISLFRDYAPLINRSGYESLKESGLKTITNDSLRLQIITLYDYYYGIIEVLDSVDEMQSFDNYFAPVNSILYPFMEFNDLGELSNITTPINITSSERKELLSYFWRLETNRNYKLNRYKSILDIMNRTKSLIEKELN